MIQGQPVLKYIDINEKYLLRFLNCYVNHKSQAKIIFPSTRLVYKGRPGLLKEESLFSTLIRTLLN